MPKRKPKRIPTAEEIRASGKPEWQMSAQERRILRAAEYKESKQRQRLANLHRHEKDKPKPSDVTVTHADGTVEVQPRYGRGKANFIINEGNLRLPEVRRFYLENGYGGDQLP